MYSWHLKQLHFKNGKCSANSCSFPTAVMVGDNILRWVADENQRDPAAGSTVTAYQCQQSKRWFSCRSAQGWWRPIANLSLLLDLAPTTQEKVWTLLPQLLSGHIGRQDHASGFVSPKLLAEGANFQNRISVNYDICKYE